MKINEVPTGHIFKKVNDDKLYLKAAFNDEYNCFDLTFFRDAYIFRESELEDLGFLNLDEYWKTHYSNKVSS